MANMIGVWKSVPELTTGHDEYSKEMGMSAEEIEATRSLVYIVSLTRDGDEWGMQVDLENKGNWLDLKFRLGVPFDFIGVDKVTKNTSVITLKDGHFLEKLTTVKDGVTRHSNVDIYREGDIMISKQTINGKTETHKLRKQ